MFAVMGEQRSNKSGSIKNVYSSNVFGAFLMRTRAVNPSHIFRLLFIKSLVNASPYITLSAEMNEKN